MPILLSNSHEATDECPGMSITLMHQCRVAMRLVCAGAADSACFSDQVVLHETSKRYHVYQVLVYWIIAVCKTATRRLRHMSVLSTAHQVRVHDEHESVNVSLEFVVLPE